MNTAADAPETSPPWSRRLRDTASVLWPAFLVAAASSVLVFGLFDPLDLAEISSVSLPMNRMAGYAGVFFFLWLICSGAAALSIFMLRSYQRRGR